MAKLYEELKRRRVFRVAAVYAVVAWVLIQVSDIVLPTFGTPVWVNQTLVFLFIIGFPIAVVLAWAFEISPEGVSTDSKIQSAPSATNATDRKLTYAIFALVLLVAGFQLTDRFLKDPEVNPIELAEQGIVEAAPLEVARFNMYLGISYPKLYDNLPTDLAISPNGQNIVYTINTPTNSELYVRNTRELEARKLFEDDTLGAFAAYKPKVSPNGQQILFGNGLNLLLMALDGGPTRRISGNIEPIGGWGWLNDSQIVYVSDNKELVLYSLSSNSEEALFTPSDVSPSWPEGIPGKNAFFYSAVETGQGGSSRSVRLYDLDTGESSILLERAYQAKYVPSGHIVFFRGSTHWAVPFDLESMEAIGPEVPIEDGISNLGALSEAVSTVSESGRLAYLPASRRIPYIEIRKPVWVDRQGNEEALAIEAGIYFSPRISADGSKLALGFASEATGLDIAIWDFATQLDSRLTFSGDVSGPLWSPDGSQLFYYRDSNQAEQSGIWRFSANGLGQPERLLPTDGREQVRLLSIDPRNNRLIYRIGQSTINNEIRSFAFNGDESNELLFPRADQYEGTISPDGNWIAIARRDGAALVAIFVSPYPNTQDGTFLVSANGRQPLWGPDSDEIFYIDDQAKILRSAKVVSTEPFLTEPGPDIASNIHHDIAFPPSYAISPDGERFLVLKYEDEDFTQERRLDLVIVDNWFEELKRLAPPDPQ